MADLGLTNSPLIRDLYNTPDEAMLAAAALGISGFRVYNINGQTKYVPGATFVEYERAIQLVKIQGKIAKRGDETFGGKLVGLQWASTNTAVEGDPLLTFGNFSISTSKTIKSGSDVVNNDAPKTYTAETITDQINDSRPAGSSILLEDVINRIDENLRIQVNFDRRKLENYVMFSSLKERIRQAIQEIILQFPAALHMIPATISHPTVVNYVQYLSDNQSIITLNQNAILNPLEIDYSRAALNKELVPELSKFRNFAKHVSSYVLVFNGLEYPLISAQLPNGSSDAFKLTVAGFPFANQITASGSFNANFYVKPAKQHLQSFYEGLSDLAAFLVNVDGGLDYTANVMVPRETDNGVVINELQSFTFPKADEYNIDVTGDQFDHYLEQLNSLADDFDRFKTNLIGRFLTTDSLQEFDTEDRKFNVVMQMYGRVFDQVKQYIDGLTYMRSISYDKMETVPDALLKNFARMLGLKTSEIQDEDTLIKSLFSFDNAEIEGDLTPAELDIEIWRRILANVSYLFKSKGTRKSIEFILELIGVPEAILEINEFVYVADGKVDPVEVDRLLYGTNDISGVGLFPYDADGYPTTPNGIPFQSNGGNLRSNDENVGPYDFGKEYINAYKKFDNVFGFDMYRTVDNQKSWAVSTTERYRENTQDLRHTFYYEKDSRLVVNSKEMDVYIALDRIFDVYPYRHLRRNGIKIDKNLNRVYKTATDPSKLTFDQYVSEVLNNYINVRNRKTIQTYPTLSKIYFDYLSKFNKETEAPTVIPGYTLVHDTDVSYGSEQAVIFTDTTNFIVDTYLPSISLWENMASNNVDGRPNVVGVFASGNPLDVVLKLTRKVTIPTTGTYYVAGAFDDDAFIKINGQYIFHGRMTLGGYSHLRWNMFPVHLEAGVVDLEVGTENVWGPGLIACEIYNNTRAQLLAATQESDLNILFSTKDEIGNTVNDTYVCQAGWTLEEINGVPTCVKNQSDLDKNGYVTFRQSMEFINKFDTYWIKFIEQFLPATTIVNAGKKIDNSLHFQNKFKYRHGKNVDVEWLGTDGAEHQHKALRPVVKGSVQAADTTGKQYHNYRSVLRVFDISGISNRKYTAYDTSINDYYGTQYSIGDYCELKDGVHIWDDETNYLNLESTAGMGVFVIFNNKLYRLRAKTYIQTQQPTMTDISGIEPPDSVHYDLISDHVDACHITFADCPNPTVTQRDYFIDTIGFALAYKRQDADFDCPPPKPHVCYWDFDGKGVNMLTTGYTQYVDDLGATRYVRQPQRFSYSMDTGSTRPFNAVYGTPGAWAIPYYQPKTWTTGNTYYEGEVVTNAGLNYMMIQDAVAVSSTVTGGTLTTIVPGLYQKLEERTKTDPFMHIQTAYLDVFVNDPTQDKLSINLTKDLSMLHIFSGATQDTSYRVVDNVIDEQIFISDSVTITMDGLYPVDADRVGPAYTTNTEEAFSSTVSDSVLLRQGEMNYVDIRSFGTGFTNNSVNFVLTEELPGYYLVSNTAFLTFKFELFFESDFRGDQDVVVYMVNQNGKVINEERFSFIGNDRVENRIMTFLSQSVFLANQRLYLAIKPLDVNCRLVRYETITFDSTQAGFTQANYFELNDPRFRLNFNGGRSINDGYIYEPAISISPVSNLFKANSIFYKTDDDNAYAALYVTGYQPRQRIFNELEFGQDVSEQYLFNYLYGSHYKKIQLPTKQAVPTIQKRAIYDREAGYDRIDFEYGYQTRRIPSNRDFNAKLIAGETVHLKGNITSMFVGNTMVDHENAQPSKNMVIGQSPAYKSLAYDGKIVPATGSTISLYGYSSGLADYEALNYKNKSNYFDQNYTQHPISDIHVTGTTVTKDIDKPIPPKSVRESVLYQNIVSAVEYFDKRIINYRLHDVVKVTDKVLKEDILYVCVRDIHKHHYDQNGIKDTYCVGGDKSVFVEITKYNPRDFEITGYKDSAPPFATKTGIKDFVDDDIILTVTGATAYTIADIKPGQIIKHVNGSNVRYHKLVYNKELTFKAANSYLEGDFVLHNGDFHVCKADKPAGIAFGTAYFDQIDPIGSNSWSTDHYVGAAFKIFYNAQRLPDQDFAAGKLYFHRSKKYNGQPYTGYYYSDSIQTVGPQVNNFNIPTGTTAPASGAYPDVAVAWYHYASNEFFNTHMPLFEVVDGIEDLPMNYQAGKMYNTQGALVNTEDRRLGDTKVLFNNKIYDYIGTDVDWTGTTQNTPQNSPEWEAKDFMLVEKMTYYKERTKIRVYDGTVISLTSDMRNNFRMFNSDTSLKSGFTRTTFAASHSVGDVVNGHTYTFADVLNEGMMNGLNLIDDVKDSNKRLVIRYGKWDLRRDQNDLILDYYYDRDKTGNLPLTGEFVGLMRVSNPCGHSAAVVMGLTLTNKQNSLSLVKPKDLDIIKLDVPVDVTPYSIRVLINQTGGASGTISWSGAATGSAVIDPDSQFDQLISVAPDKELTFTVTYNIANRFTRFDYAMVDDVNMFPTLRKFGQKLINNHLFVSEAFYDDNLRTESRTFTIKTTKENHIVRIGLRGFEQANRPQDLPFNNMIDLNKNYYDGFTNVV
jgi:hypothetical protein